MFVHEKLQWFICPVFQVTGVFSKEYIPQGTRFGPLQGEIYTKDNVPKLANRKYFWRVRETTCFTSFFVHWRLSINQPTGKVLLKKGKVSSLNVKKRDWEETRNYYGQVFVCYSWKKKKKKTENTGCSEGEVSHQVFVHTSIGERNAFAQIALPHRSFGQNFRGSCDRRWHVTVDWNAYTVMRLLPALKPYATCVTCTKDRTIFHNPHAHIHRILIFPLVLS